MAVRSMTNCMFSLRVPVMASDALEGWTRLAVVAQILATPPAKLDTHTTYYQVKYQSLANSRILDIPSNLTMVW